MDINLALQLLDTSLTHKGLKREFTICGGAALNLQGLTLRDTQDIDILVPRIDESLKAISVEIASKEGLNTKWLNNGAAHFATDLMPGWEDRVFPVYNGKSLTVFSISRIDLLAMKFLSFYDRMSDLRDIVAIKPTRGELEKVFKFAKNVHPHLINDQKYHDGISSRFQIILSELGYE